MKYISISLLVMVGFGCSGDKKDKDGLDDRFAAMIKVKPCKDDNECIKGTICTDGKCQKGKRSEAELKAKKKELEEKAKKAQVNRNKVKAGEGRLKVRICPFYKNTSNSSASLFAENQKTKKKHWLALHNQTPPDGLQTVFTFPSLPLGNYDVTLRMGVRVRGQHDLTDMNCHPKAKPCRGGTVREMDVILPKDEPPAELKEDGSEKLPPCDFVAE
ncbi:MAG: hypothetical protein CMH52_02205 [Myxococcales bacterium]|nr:hypothetical protein [Myxococcales bacterium]|tara:strand:+ start:958 stop:1605 length:648 start_codon:yes stop_codon:yes gene_type:complete